MNQSNFRQRSDRSSGLHNADWSSVDWTKTNAEIANILGVTPQAVTHARRRTNHPSERAPRRRFTVEDFMNVNWHHDLAYIARQVGCSVGTARLFRHKMTTETADGPHGEWAHHVDWAKPSSLIAAETGQSMATVSRARITYGNGRRAEYHANHFLKLYEAELMKLSELFTSPDDKVTWSALNWAIQKLRKGIQHEEATSAAAEATTQDAAELTSPSGCHPSDQGPQ